MNTTGWYLKDTAHPEKVSHAHPLVIVATEQEAMDKRISKWHYASDVHENATLHAYYNSFDADSTRWADANKGNAYKRITANLSPAQRRQIILNAQAAHNNGATVPAARDNAPPTDAPEFQEPVYGGRSDDLPPGQPYTPTTPPATLPNGKPDTDQLAAITALVEEQAKMSALGLRANVETRSQLNTHVASTSQTLSDLRESLRKSEEAREAIAAQTSALVATVRELEARTPREVIIKLRDSDGTETVLPGGRHRVFPKLLAYTRAITPGRLGIWLTGGAGTGKTTLAMHIAEATERQFRLQGAVTAKHDLLGYMDAHGKYVSTPFRDAYENGHLLLLDEVDASFPAGTLAIQAAVSNKVCQFPDSVTPVVMHPRFALYCAANTTGQGADALYSGRTKQDAAFLDRFMKVHVDYDEDWELSITPSSLTAWTKAVQQVRANVSSARNNNRSAPGASAQIIISVRSIFFGIDLLTNSNVSATTIVDDIFRAAYGNVNSFDTLFAPVYDFAREFDRLNPDRESYA